MEILLETRFDSWDQMKQEIILQDLECKVHREKSKVGSYKILVSYIPKENQQGLFLGGLISYLILSYLTTMQCMNNFEYSLLDQDLRIPTLPAVGSSFPFQHLLEDSIDSLQHNERYAQSSKHTSPSFQNLLLHFSRPC